MLNYIVELQATTTSTSEESSTSTSSSTFSSGSFGSFFGQIEAGETQSVFISGIPNINKVNFITNQNLENQQLNVLRVYDLPFESKGLWHSFYKIDSGLIGNNLESSEIYFNVEKEWVEEKGLGLNDVTLFHYTDNSWIDLPTSSAV